jgi:hypothetical protein
LEKRNEAMDEIKFEIVKHIGVLSESTRGWKKELNIVKWNDKEPKYDIRDWAPEYAKMGKGVTLTKEEIIEIQKLIENI